MTVDRRPTERPLNHTDDGGAAADSTRAELMLNAARVGVLELVRQSRVHPAAVRLAVGNIRIEMDWAHTSSPPAVISGTAGTPPGPAATEVEPGLAAGAPSTPAMTVVTAPAVGVFYRAPEPGARPFVEVGDTIGPGQKVGLIEAMKLMIPVEADHAGTVTEIVGVNGEAVEYGQPLIVISPTGQE